MLYESPLVRRYKELKKGYEKERNKIKPMLGLNG